ncbi:MAG: SAM-dependent methyltransferase [Magnetococcales bacterium]|nr:SAM-dependent methyltransferase [Magnetococcales bacterium]
MHQILSCAAVTAGGVLPFDHFMELALYHPEQGYYMRRHARIGRSGDFVTAPEITSLFGELLTLQWVEVWELLGRPARFDLVELGAGTGRLACDVLMTARRFPDFARALHYVIVERSCDFRARQQEMLAPLESTGVAVTWMEDLDSLAAAMADGVVGGIFSNEFFDALPVHWVTMTDAGLRALGATWNGESWQVAETALPPEVVADHFSRRGITLETGYRTEIGSQAMAWMERLGSLLRHGVVLTIDYGHPERDYYHPSCRAGHLVGHRRHERIDDPLASPGEMDLTAHVDFSSLARSGERAGLTTLGFTTQGWFLLGLGILTRLEQLLAREKMIREERERLQSAVRRLIMPDAMGERFKVLVQGVGLPPDTTLAGFRLNDQRLRL